MRRKNYIIEPRHDKTNLVHLPPAWIQTSLHIRAVWSGSMLFAISFSTCNRDCKRTAWILIRLVWIHAGANALCWFCHGAAHICLLRHDVIKLQQEVQSIENVLGAQQSWFQEVLLVNKVISSRWPKKHSLFIKIYVLSLLDLRGVPLISSWL
jgi:hypothetical protein